jgi:hypothetical protein
VAFDIGFGQSLRHKNMAKALHIIIAFVVMIILRVLFHWIGWDWAGWPISILFIIYAGAILFSPRSNPVPLSRAANERYDAYVIYCTLSGKEPSLKEDDSTWIPKLPYPMAVMAAFRRSIDALRAYSANDGNFAKYKKLEGEANGFVAACHANGSLVAKTVLDDLIFRACPNIPDRDKETLSRAIGQV